MYELMQERLWEVGSLPLFLMFVDGCEKLVPAVALLTVGLSTAWALLSSSVLYVISYLNVNSLIMSHFH